ncbi:MAG: hypothetical protein ACXQTS_03180 [Candidatus Methanospirareceae archaeon]
MDEMDIEEFAYHVGIAYIVRLRDLFDVWKRTKDPMEVDAVVRRGLVSSAKGMADARAILDQFSIAHCVGEVFATVDFLICLMRLGVIK